LQGEVAGDRGIKKKGQEGDVVSYLKLVADECVEQTDVGIPEPGEEDVLFNVGRLAPELGEGTLLLGLEGLDLGRAQSMEMKGIAKLGRGSSA
jgi:hypothetical protein